ncbi:MAG: SDR family oxidoreductase [Paracoccaceae bacterium]
MGETGESGERGEDAHGRAPPAYGEALAEIRASPRRWLVTGAAGFIGSHLTETLLAHGQTVTGLDNFANGFPRNLDEIRARTDAARFTFLEGDIRDPATCARAVADAEIVLHQAALGSVPRSLADPQTSTAANVTGHLNMLVAARDAGARMVWAGSSSSYGDHPALPKIEDRIGAPLSPYALTKRVNEMTAEVFARSYGYRTIGLRYFNVFGPRQRPDGPYAAVIPRWTGILLAGGRPEIYGDGETSRDFTYVANAVQANILAALAPEPAWGEVYNVAAGGRTTLRALFEAIRHALAAEGIATPSEPHFRPFRDGDVRHSLADISKARRLLGYAPSHDVPMGLAEAMPWYLDHLGRPAREAAR